MYILFSPSEGKKKGGDKTVFSEKSFLFPELFDKRLSVLNQYNNYIKSASDEQSINSL